MERIKKIISCFVSNTLHFCLEYFITLPSGRCLAENWGCCRSSKAEGVTSYPKLEKRWLLELYGSIPWSFFAILPLLNVEGIVLWMVLSILLVYTTFIPYSSMQNACSLSHSCLILHPSSSTSYVQALLSPQLPLFLPMCLPSPQAIPGWDSCGLVNLVWMEIRCPWPEPAIG